MLQRFLNLSFRFVKGPPSWEAQPAIEWDPRIRRARAAVKIPVIGSLNGTSVGGWLSYGRAIEEVGADALELNIFDVPMNEQVSGADIERETVEMVRELRHHGGNQTCVEDCFDEATKATIIGGKTFCPENNIDETKNYGKKVFAHKVVRPNADKLDLRGFRLLAANIVSAITAHEAAMADAAS